MYRYFLLAAIVLAQGCSAVDWQSFANSPPQQTVEAHKIVLVDSNGKPIAELGAAPGGSGLVLMDSAGKPRAALIVTQTGEPGLKLYDRAGVVRAALVVANDGRSGLALYDARSKNRAALAANPEGSSALMLFDGDGRPTAVVPPPISGARGTRAGPPSG